MGFLVIDFGAKKVDMPKMQDDILEAVRYAGIIVKMSPLNNPEPIGASFDSPRVSALRRYKWSLELQSEVSESTLRILKERLSENEVYGIYLEDDLPSLVFEIDGVKDMGVLDRILELVDKHRIPRVDHKDIPDPVVVAGIIRTVRVPLKVQIDRVVLEELRMDLPAGLSVHLEN